MEQKRQDGIDLRKRISQFIVDEDELTLRKSSLALKHKSQAEILHKCHEELLEAEIRLLEATSDLETLKQRNSGIAEQLSAERRVVQEVTRDAEEAKKAASAALKKCQAILSDAEDADYFRDLDPQLTMDDLRNEIEAEKSKLTFVQEGNSGALREFEGRKAKIDRLTAKLHESEKRLETYKRKIGEIRENWEPELDKLIGEISEAFSYNFEQIGCAGEVGIHKDDDFDLWSIEIKVKFRYASIILTKHIAY